MKHKVPEVNKPVPVGYFDEAGPNGIRCVAAALSVDSKTHIVICAPDTPTLKRGWKEITNIPLDLKKSVVVIYKYEPKEETEKLPRKILLDSDENGLRPDRNERYWFIHPESDCCFIEYGEYDNTVGGVELLGPAKKGTEIECKLLLRNLGWKRSAIDSFKISTQDPIPF